MSNSEHVDGSTILFKATPIHEGPLNGYKQDPQRNFRSATYNVAKCDKEITLYRLYGKEDSKYGSWWTPVKPETFGNNALASRIDYAVLECWGNTMEHCAELRVPAGTLIFSGIAGEQIETYPNQYKHGGKCQVFLPEEIKNGILEYNKTGNTSLLHSEQKKFIQNWEKSNFKITNNSGKAVNMNPAQLQKLQTSAGVAKVPDLSKINDNTFKLASTPKQLNSVSYRPPTNAIRETRKFTQKNVKNTFISSNSIPKTQCYIKSPWPGGVEFVEALPLYHQEINESMKIIDPKISIDNSKLLFFSKNGILNHIIRKFGISTKNSNNLPSLSPDEMKGLHEACTKSTKNGIMISLELHEKHINTITDGFDPKTYPEIFDTIKEADVLLGNFIFGTNMFQAALEENSNIELTKSDVTTFQNPYDVEYQLLKGHGDTKAKADVSKFSHIGAHPKFVINKNASLIIKDDILLCHGCPLDISCRGIYIDFYGNTYYDDDGVRCYKNHPFINDFRKNFWNYFEAYPVLKKLATYAMVVAAILNGLKLTNEKQDFQALSKTPSQNSASTGLKEIEMKILQAKEDILRQQPNSNPFAWDLLGNDWYKYDQLTARNFYFESLLDIHFGGSLQEGKARMEADFYKKRIAKNSCLGILATAIFGNDEDNKTFTDGEKKILSKIFAINDMDDYSIKLALLGISVNLILNLETWADFKLFVDLLWQMLADEEAKLKNEAALPTLKESWKILLSSHDWSKVSNGIQLSSLLTNISNSLSDVDKIEKHLKPNAKKLYLQLSSSLSTMMEGGGLSWLTKKIGALFSKESHESNPAMMLSLSAMGYQILPYLWILNPNFQSTQNQQILNELYLQISFFIRSLSAAFYLINDKDTKNKLEWIVLTRDSLREFLVYVDIGSARTNAIEIEQGLESIKKSLKILPSNLKQKKEAIESVLSEMFDFRTIAEGSNEAADIAEGIAMIYSQLGENLNASLWNETAKLDRKKMGE